MSTSYTELLTGLGRYLGLPDGDALADVQEIVVDDIKIGFDFEPLDVNEPVVGDVVFFTVLGRPAAGREAAIHRFMLEGNNLWAGTGGATLGVQQDGGAAVLAMRLPVETLTPEDFADVLENFLDTARFWRAVVAGEAGAGTAPAFVDFGQRA